MSINEKTDERGVALVEAIVFMVVVALSLSSIVGLYVLTTKNSNNSLEAKNGLEFATALLEEIQAQPFTWCEPEDVSMPSATSQADCLLPQSLSPGSGESRGGGVPFDNVGDYNGFSMSPPSDPSNTPFGTVANGWSVSASLSPVRALASSGEEITASSGDFVKIEVRAVSPSGKTFVTTGYRSRYAPTTE